MAQRSCTIQFVPPSSPVVPPVTSIPCTVTGSTVAGLASQTLDAIDPAAAFQANDGDEVLVTATNVNALGSSPPASAFFIVAAGVVAPSAGATPGAPVFASITGT